MKKNIKKFASLMLALVMAIGLAAPAFAAPVDVEPATDITVNLQLKDQTGNIFTANSVSLPAGSNVYDLVTKYFPETTGSVWNTSGNSKFLQTIICDGKTYSTAPLTDAPTVDDKGKPISFLAWKDGYGLISHGTNYAYYYAGNAWTYAVLDVDGEEYGSVSDLAMNQFTLNSDDTVELTYALQTSRWTQDDPLSQNYPFLPEKSTPSDITVSLQLVGKDGNIVAPTNMTLSANSTAYDLVVKYFAATDKSVVVNRSEWATSGSSMFLQTIICNNTPYATKGLEAAPAVDSNDQPLNFMDWTDGPNGKAWRNGYGLLNDQNGYEYYYAGNAWVYTVVNADGEEYGSVNNLAMNQFDLHAGDAVKLTYEVQTSRWTQSSPLSNTYPYLPVEE